MELKAKIVQVIGWYINPTLTSGSFIYGLGGGGQVLSALQAIGHFRKSTIMDSAMQLFDPG